MEKSVDSFFAKAGRWQESFIALREIVLSCGLKEELKWGKPCYTFRENNVVLIHGFKDYCALLFIKGALLKDEYGILVQQTENVQAGRQVRFKSLEEIRKQAAILKTYIFDAVEVEKAGLNVEFKKTKEYPVPDELTKMFDAFPDFKSAFETLTPGRQRGYLLHFSAPKQTKTREARIEKNLPRILMGKGLNDS